MDDESELQAKKTKRKSRPPRKVTSNVIREQALRYLDRYSTTTSKLKRHLINKNRKAILYHDQDAEELEICVDQVIESLEKIGVLNDQLYADFKARSMARQGKSIRQIKNKLYEHGLDGDQSEHALTELTETEGHSDRIGAAKYIRKRKFGPYKDKEIREDRYEKELMAMARNGFGFQLSQELLKLDSIEEIEDIIFNKNK